jgi:hypothetical protein
MELGWLSLLEVADPLELGFIVAMMSFMIFRIIGRRIHTEGRP